MESNGSTNGTQSEAPKVSTALDMQKRGICVTTPVGGKPVKMSGDKPEDFLPYLKDSTLTWINFSVDDIQHDAEHITTLFGFSSAMTQSLLASYISGYEDTETELGILLPAIRVKKFDVSIHPLLILIRQGLVITIHEAEIVRLVKFARYADTFMRKIKQEMHWQDKQATLLNRIIDENNSANFDHLRKIEEQGEELSRFLIDASAPKAMLGAEIYSMKHALITYMDALWATIDVISNLRYGDAEMISDNQKILARTGILMDDVNRQIALSEHMSEVLASGLEVLQSIYNNQLQILNNRLTAVNNKLAMVAMWLAVIGAAVMVPNTLATIFGVPAISDAMQEYGGASTIYVILIASTVLSALAVYFLLKRRRWIPNIDEKEEP